MGSKLIWIAVAFAYGAVCAAIYTLVSRKHGVKNLLTKGLVAFAAYTLLGLIMVYVVWRIFAI